MRIDTIHYSRKCSDGNYGNLELGMHAQLEDTDDPLHAAAHLRAQVEGVLAKERDNLQALHEDATHLSDLQMEIERKEQNLARATQQWAQTKAFLEQHGVDTSRYHDNPF